MSLFMLAKHKAIKESLSTMIKSICQKIKAHPLLVLIGVLLAYWTLSYFDAFTVGKTYGGLYLVNKYDNGQYLLPVLQGKISKKKVLEYVMSLNPDLIAELKEQGMKNFDIEWSAYFLGRGAGEVLCIPGTNEKAEYVGRLVVQITFEDKNGRTICSRSRKEVDQRFKELNRYTNNCGDDYLTGDLSGDGVLTLFLNKNQDLVYGTPFSGHNDTPLEGLRKRQAKELFLGLIDYLNSPEYKFK